MPHLDDGRLTAWVDGALAPGGPEAREIERHLAACEDCRQRLEEARALRERVTAILARAEVAVAPGPALEELAERAAETGRSALSPPGPRPGPARRGTSARGMAWAASLALAVGAGWIARDLALRRGEPLPPAAGAPAASEIRDDAAKVGSLPSIAAAEEEVRQESPAPGREAARAGRSVAKEDLAGTVEDPAGASFRAPPPEARVSEAPQAGATATGCWTRVGGPGASTLPERIRLAPESGAGRGQVAGGSLLGDPGGDARATWIAFGPDSVWIGGEGTATMRLRIEGDRLEGRVFPRGAAAEPGVAGADAAGSEPADVVWRRTPCEP